MAGDEADTMKVEVAHARPELQVILTVDVPPGATVGAALAAAEAGLLDRFPDLDLAAADVGVFGKVVKRDQPLRAGDRVEIYRRLLADPKEIRKQRAAEGKLKKRGGAGADEED